MTKEEFKEKIESGETVRYGCTSFYKDGKYYYSHFVSGIHGEGTEGFENFEELWSEVSHYFIYGVDYSENRELGKWPALSYDPQRFNNMADSICNSVVTDISGPALYWFCRGDTGRKDWWYHYWRRTL